jgi:anthranilate synthase component 1
MIKPSLQEVMKLAGAFNTIPVTREIYADVTTPILLLRKLAAASRRFFLLESVEGGEKWGLYSFLGYDPVRRAVCRDGVDTIEGENPRRVKTDKPLWVLRELLSR